MFKRAILLTKCPTLTCSVFANCFFSLTDEQMQLQVLRRVVVNCHEINIGNFPSNIRC